ncbi:NAD(P)-dependent oxidoreductase [Paenalcaligenes sp.]|uniref:NAD(P)-dependent oxidoreductase n=1 Tax=Paenalcaligenes sp. TaxID=1966342 RepID=UPI00261C72E1|nr:NAD(P)-dependent oxidoreductase [Paenalcaligenes sp.]
MRVGFVGLGRMGLPMCQRLLQAGHTLTVWNRSSEKAHDLIKQGAQLATTPAQLAAQSDIILMCLFDAAAIETVMYGEQGLASVTSANKIIVDHATVSPQQTKQLAARLPQGWIWLDAPVSGGTAGAEAGTLAVMVGGEASALQQVRPYLQAYAARITHMGAVGAGQVTKLCNQTIVTATIAAIAEAVCLAQEAHIDSKQLATALAGGWADSTLLPIFVERMHNLPSEATATVQTMLKDLTAITDLATLQQTAMPVSHTVYQLYQLAAKQGLVHADVSHIIQTLQGKQ